MADDTHSTGTTHAEWGAGSPRLIVRGDDERFTRDLGEDELTIGSAAGAGLRLPGLDPIHATVVHDERDEFVVTLHGSGSMNANTEAAGVHSDVGGDRTETLRTGAEFTAGSWSFVFQREEFADHGRPYGGREGGELSDQPPQPARPDYTGQEDRTGEQEIQEH
ncbi:FHA domain-containing protein [Microbacterium sp. G2-8]|uniref:FHA domain-containing protein n=1 Tax=Microbacterium sp. G2-8 TaxID=2842454 RepID=UPI001C89DB9E|nr:FHA domain-containing protein [Microbacterium sp. G2-8]